MKPAKQTEETAIVVEDPISSALKRGTVLEENRVFLKSRQEEATASILGYEKKIKLLQGGDKRERENNDGNLATIIEGLMFQKDKAENELKAIDRALKRINEGTYFICVSCHGEIPLARIEKQCLPMTNECCACARSSGKSGNKR